MRSEAKKVPTLESEPRGPDVRLIGAIVNV